MSAGDRWTWLFPEDVFVGDGPDVGTFDPFDEDDRQFLLLADHPELASAIEEGVDEVVLHGVPVSPTLHLAMHDVVVNRILDPATSEWWDTAQRPRHWATTATRHCTCCATWCRTRCTRTCTTSHAMTTRAVANWPPYRVRGRRCVLLGPGPRRTGPSAGRCRSGGRGGGAASTRVPSRQWPPLCSGSPPRAANAGSCGRGDIRQSVTDEVLQALGGREPTEPCRRVLARRDDVLRCRTAGGRHRTWRSGRDSPRRAVLGRTRAVAVGSNQPVSLSVGQTSNTCRYALVPLAGGDTSSTCCQMYR